MTKPPDSDFGVVVYGSVSGSDGKPVESLYINFISPDKDRTKNRNTSCDKGGYAVHGLQPGGWQVQLRGTGIKTTTQQVEILAQETQRLDLVAQRAYVLRVKMLTPEGEPTHDAMTKAKMYHSRRLVAVATRARPEAHFSMRVEVRVVDADTRQPIAKARVGLSDAQSGGGGLPTGDDGTVVLKDQAPGIVELDVWAKDYAQHHRVLRLDPGKHHFEVLLSRPIKIEGRVVDSAGEPQTATIYWTNLDHRTFPQEMRNRRTARAKADGKFELHSTGRGRYLVFAKIRGKAAAIAEIDTSRVGDKPLELVTMPVTRIEIDARSMPRSKVLTFTIRNDKGTPVWARYFYRPASYSAELPAGRYAYEVHDGLETRDRGDLEVKIGGKPKITVR